MKNHADAEDITQEVFLKIIRHDMRYQSMEHERAWIVRVTVNLCRDLLKSKWHKTSVSMERSAKHREEAVKILRKYRMYDVGGITAAGKIQKLPVFVLL